MIKYRPDIDGLRAIAIIPVVLFHCGFNIFSGGFVGVDIFFVISGFLITSIISSAVQNGVFKLTEFYKRRVLRLLPALFVVLFFSTILSYLLMQTEDLQNFSQSLIGVVTFSSNFLFWWETGYFDTASTLKPLLHTWSLAIEEQFYFFFPILVVFFMKKTTGLAKLRSFILFVTICSFTLCVFASFNHTNANFFLLPFRVWELMFGALLALWSVQDRKTLFNFLSFTGLCLILLSIFMIDSSITFPGFYALLPVLGVGLVLRFTTKRAFVFKLLSHKALVHIGLISYSTYLWHQPIVSFYHIYKVSELLLWEKFALAALSFIMGYVSWKFIENPFRKKIKTSTKTLYSAVAFCSIAFGGVGVYGHFNVPKAPILEAGFGDLVIPKKFPGIILHGKNCSFPKTKKDICKIQGVGSDNVIVVLGDSHARVLTEPFFKIKKGYKYFYDMTASGCPFLMGLNSYSNHSVTDCASSYQEFRLKMIKELKAVHKNMNLTVVLSARLPLYLYGDGFDNGVGGVEERKPFYSATRSRESFESREIEFYLSLESGIENLKAIADKVVVVLPNHTNGWNVIKRAKKVGVGAQSETEFIGLLETSYAAVKKRREPLVNFIKRVDSIVVVDPVDLTCDRAVGKCYGYKNGALLFTDSDHLSFYVNEWIHNQVLEGLER